MKFGMALLPAAIAAMSACATGSRSDPSPEEAQTAKRHLDAVWREIDKAIDEAGNLPDESAKNTSLVRISNLNDQLVYSGLLLVMSTAVPNRDGFEQAASSIFDVDCAIAELRRSFEKTSSSQAPQR